MAVNSTKVNPFPPWDRKGSVSRGYRNRPANNATTKNPATLASVISRFIGSKSPPESTPITRPKNTRVSRSSITQLAMITRATRVLARPRSFRLVSVMTTAVAVMVSPTKVAPTRSIPNSHATPKLTENGTMAPTTATPSDRFSAS